MKSIELHFQHFKSDRALHKAFAEIMGFPSFYGHNWNAWIDCMSYIDDKSAGMSLIHVKPGEMLEIVVTGYKYSDELYKAESFQEMCSCAGFVNTRFKKLGLSTRLVICN